MECCAGGCDVVDEDNKFFFEVGFVFFWFVSEGACDVLYPFFVIGELRLWRGVFCLHEEVCGLCGSVQFFYQCVHDEV